MAMPCSWKLKKKTFLFSTQLKYYLFVDIFFLIFLSNRDSLSLSLSTPSELSNPCLNS